MAGRVDGVTENDVGVQGSCSALISWEAGKPTKTIDFIEILQKVASRDLSSGSP
jgi:hypothetical protein